MPQIAENQIADQAAAQGEAVLPEIPAEPVAATTDTEETAAGETPTVAASATEATISSSETTTSEANLVDKIIGAMTYPFEVLVNLLANLF